MPTIRNSRSWGIGRLPLWLLDDWEEAGRIGVNRAHLKVGMQGSLVGSKTVSSTRTGKAWGTGKIAD